MNISKIFIISGTCLLTSGILIYFFEDKLNWFGNLPLDFKYENDNTRIYAPIGSMIIASIILSLIMNLFSKLFK